MNSLWILAVGAVAVLAIMFVVARLTRRLNPRVYRQRWKEVLELTNDRKHGYKLAVIEGDKLVDRALKQLRYPGKTMGERLVSAQRNLSNPDSIWWAHKLRNRLVHEDNVKLQKKHVKQALQGFERALKDLGAL